MIIRYKEIIKDRFDAPFVGTLISAISCPFNCPDCINEYLKDDTFSKIDANEFIKSVKDDPMQEGIILAGLEWTEQPAELSYLIDTALKNDLKVILYTGLPNRTELLKKVPSLVCFTDKGVYVKYGNYQKDKHVDNYVSYGVLLDTSNQYIELL